MENEKQISKEQTLTLTNKQNLSITGTKKVISLKPDLIQLDTVFGGLIIAGENLELIRLDNSSTRADIKGNVCQLKYIEGKTKEPLFRKIFK